MKASLIFVLAQCAIPLPVSGETPQLWFSPGDDLEVRGVVTHPDFPKLFEEPSQWPAGMSHINVLQFRAPYIARKPAESAKYHGYLKAHGIAVAATMALVPAESCGQGVEGIMSHKGIDFYSRAIKNAGVQLDYVVWIASAKENAQAIASTIRARPDHIMIQTWESNPSRIVPEADPGTMTGYLKWFVEQPGR